MGTIAEKMEYLRGTKTAIADALIEQGISIESTDTFRSYAEKITSINILQTIDKTWGTMIGTWREYENLAWRSE